AAHTTHILLVQPTAALPHLHPFPTRRSSDLPGVGPGRDGNSGGGPRRAGGDVTAPILIRSQEPKYTSDAMLAKIQGRVELDLRRSEEHTSELQSLRHLVCRLLLEKKKKNTRI